MKKTLIILIITITASLFSSAYLFWNLPAFIILIAALVIPFPQASILAFTTGLVDDLVWTRTLGTTSLILLVTIGLLELYSRKYDRFHPFFLLVFSFIALTASTYLQSYQLQLLPNLLLAIIITLTRSFWQLLRAGDRSVIHLSR